MAVTVKVDRQGRVVIPQRERERLGVTDGGILELVATPEGVLLERRRRADVRLDDRGLPLVRIEDAERVSNDDSLEAIHRHRDRL
jgi:AbrB family looped-hinge helix DNA binding protein